MAEDAVLRIGREALLLVLLVSALPMLVAMGVSLIVGLFQTATQVQEGTLPVVPRLICVYAAIALGGYWMLREIARFTVTMFEAIGQV
jgi:flagellar biosynthesis protein FliQ